MGWTNEPASIVLRPVAASLLTRSIFVSGEIEDFSFWSPSRGPTSTIRTWSANVLDVAEKHRLLRALGILWCLNGRTIPDMADAVGGETQSGR